MADTCIRKRSDMTPCFVTDGENALDDYGRCVGCGIDPAKIPTPTPVPAASGERIAAAAIQHGKALTFSMASPARHHTIMHHLSIAGLQAMFHGEQGFITTMGRFVDRITAKRLAVESGQVETTEHDELYSEDLW